MQFTVVVGRVLFAFVFIMASFGHFSKGEIKYAADHGVPSADLLVPLSGVMALVGGLSIVLGLYGRLGAWLIVLFLIPVTLKMHNFWDADPSAKQMQQIMFMKNVSMIGGALLITYFGTGPLSLDNWLKSRRSSPMA